MAILIDRDEPLFACEICKTVFYKESDARSCETSHERN